MNKNKEIRAARELSDGFALAEGRRPRIMLAGLINDEKSGALLSLSTRLADLGFDVDLGPPSGSLEVVLQQATENDVHLIGLLFPEVGLLGTRALLGQLGSVAGEIPIILFHPHPEVFTGDHFLTNIAPLFSPKQDPPELVKSLLGIILENV